MKNFSPLTQKTLAGMPVLLDSITLCMKQLEATFSPIYDDLEKLLNENLPSKFQLTDWERGFIHLFSPKYKKGGYISSPQAFAEIRYKLEMEQNLKRSPIKFEIHFGYLCDDGQVYGKQNVVYFQLIDNSEKLLDKELLDSIKPNIPETWRIDFEDDYSSVWIEFDIDETLCVERINQCAEDFKQCILQPVLDTLKK
ncbi:MAG: hypothetical protein K2O69_05060 [Odoribacter sp.]|nr:hypothetical protein [Odoribacter sp.]